MNNLWLPENITYQSEFSLLLSFIPLNISFIPRTTPDCCSPSWLSLYLSTIWQGSDFDWSSLFFSSSSANFHLQWIPVYCSLRLYQWILQKPKNSLTSYFAPPFTSQRIFFHFITFLPKVLYTLIKLLQFFWGLWINLHLFPLLAFDLLF